MYNKNGIMQFLRKNPIYVGIKKGFENVHSLYLKGLTISDKITQKGDFGWFSKHICSGKPRAGEQKKNCDDVTYGWTLRQINPFI